MPHPPARKIRVDRKMEWIQWYKGTVPCADCGNTFHHSAMDFHHDEERRDGDNNRLITRMIRGDYSKKVIQEEMSKCVLLCSNCHRVRHFEEIHGVG